MSFRLFTSRVKKIRKELKDKVPLIGFAGAPFTLASYLIEGGGSRNYLHTKKLYYSAPEAWQRLMERLAKVVAEYLNCQIAAGAQAVQIFDSWAGCLTPDDYQQFVLPYTKKVIDAIAPGVPVINFSTGTAGALKHIRAAGGDVIGLDWRINLDEGWAKVGHDVALQGNLDPVALFASPRKSKPTPPHPAPRCRPPRSYFQFRTRRVAGDARRSRNRPGRGGTRPERQVNNIDSSLLIL